MSPGMVNTDYYDGEEPSNIAPAGLYTFDVEVMGAAYYYDADWVRSKALTVGAGSVEDLGVNEETGEHYYLVRYSLISGRDATKGNFYLYDSNWAILQAWNVSELTCLDHDAQDGLAANPEGKQHALLVHVPESMLKIGQYYFVLYFTDNSSDITKNHTNKTTLHVGQPMTVVYQVEDTNLSEIMKAVFQPNEIILINTGHSCPPPPNTLPLVADINGDGVRDWDYPGDRKIPGTNLVVGVFGIKKGTWFPQTRTFRNEGSFYLLGIGIDENNNGLLEVTEVQHWIGKCPFVHGVNWGGLIKEPNGLWYVHWISFNNIVRPTPDDIDRQAGEPLRHYIYDPYRNILKVYYDNGYGNKWLEYQGSPENYQWW